MLFRSNVDQESCSDKRGYMSSRDKDVMLVFGGSGGLGTALIEHLKWEYWVTPLSSRDVDVRQPGSVEDAIQRHKPDIVLNLSGTNYDGFLHKLDAKDVYGINNLINVNAIGAVNIISSSLRYFREKGKGRIIMVSSVLSEKVQVGTGMYSATKAFVDSLVRTASAENIGKGITVNSIRLGYFDAGMCHKIPEEYQEGIKKSIGLKRWGNPRELYNTIKYLVDTEYVTGQNITVSGGLL